jgi:hypothetical protein
VKKKSAILFILFIGLLASGVVLYPSSSYACKCVGPQSVEKEMKQSDAVFSGKVIGLKDEKSHRKILFEVGKTWKGETKSQLILVSENSSCSIEFYKGAEYLVYAREYKGLLTTDICNRTTQLFDAEEDLVILGKGKVPTEEVNLEDDIKPLAPFRNQLIIVVGVVVLAVFFIWRQIVKNKRE